jgi:hypothetical protein
LFDGLGLQGGASELHFTYPGVLDPGTPLCKPLMAAWKNWGSARKSKTILALRRRQMAHDHGYEYQVKIVHENGTEELGGWINSEEQVVQAMAAVHRAQDKAYWLRERNVVCPDCFNKEQTIILECPITDFPSPRYRPHDSQYLVAVGSRNRYESLEVVMGSRH